MMVEQSNTIELTLNQLYSEAKNDRLKLIKGLANRDLSAIEPSDFKDVYLSISKAQGNDLVQLIRDNGLKRIVEFGTSFGVSTLFLAQGVMETGGYIITTEIIRTKAKRAIENFKKAGVHTLIEVRIGDAMETLKHHKEAIDLLILDGWKDLCFPLFLMLEPNFHANTLIYVDNADMKETKVFLSTIAQSEKYQFQTKFDGKAIIITNKR
ncbi:O-methyltransferase [Winogradskyella sp. PC D3.3]